MEKNKKRAPGENKAAKVLNSIAIVFLSLVLIGSMSGFYILSKILADSPTLPIESFEGKENTVIYDAAGEEIMTLSMAGEDGTRENVSYNQIPQVVFDAFLSVEDSCYFKHNGFDLPRFLKSAVNTLKGSLQGGSTITMQMVDVTTMSKLEKPENSLVNIMRKIQEIFLAMDAEQKLDKKAVFEKYLNKINFGGPARGVQKAAQYYFGKSIENVTLSEAAFLAGVINAPGILNPYYYYENAVDRRNDTLYYMNYHGYISDEEYELALNTELAFQLEGPTLFETTPYLSYIDNVLTSSVTLSI